MDYAEMLKDHIANNAALTIACMDVPRKDASAFGVLSANQDGLIQTFSEKPTNPDPMPGDPERSLVSMGIYIFEMETLQRVLEQDASSPSSTHDFGKDIIPKLIDERKVYSYNFCSDRGRVAKDCYWRDVGTIDSFYQANMDLLEPIPPMNLYQPSWGIRTYEPQLPPARTVSSATGNEGIFINSIIASGVVNSGGSVQHSVISSNVRIDDSATIVDSILFDSVKVGKGCKLVNCIIDKHVVIPDNTEIGVDRVEDAKHFHISENGIVVVPESYKF